MKRFQKILMAVAASALAVVSCAKEEVAPETTVSEDKVYEYLFTLGEGDTKATLNDNIVTWTEGDYLGVVCKYAGGGYSYSNSNTKSKINPASGETPAKFLVKSYKALTVGGKVFCFFPYIDKQFENPNITMSIPASQNNTINEMPMASIPFEVTSDVPAQTGTEVGDIKMLMLGSIARFKIYSSNADWQGESIKSVKFETASTDIAGSFDINIEGIDLSNASTLAITLSANESKSITESVSDKTVTGDKENGIVDMVIAPGTYSGTLTITTNAATYEFTLSNKEFQRAHIKPFSVNLASENCTRTEFETAVYELVTSVDDIIPGEYLIAAEYGDAIHFVPNAAVAAKNLKNKDCTTLTLEGNDYKGDATGFNWTFEGTNSEMSIKSVAAPTCYLYATNDNNGMVVGNKNAFWSISEATNGFYLKTTDGTNDRYLSQYNSQDWRCYKSSTVSNGTAVIKLYKLHDTTPAITGANIEMTSAVGDVAESALTLHNFESAPAAADFTVVSKPDYVSECEFTDITKDGATFACIVSDNYSTENDREGEIEISVNGVSTKIIVSQPKSIFVVTAETDPLIIENTAESTCSFNIKSTFGGTLEIDDTENFDCPTSYTADATDGVTITVKAKNGGADEPRDATVTVHRAGCDDVDVNVQQNKAGATELSVPENIAISSPSTEGFSASWNEVISASGYHWILSTQSTSEAAAADASAITRDATTNSIDYEGTIAAGTYYFYVKAVGNGTSYSDSPFSEGIEVNIEEKAKIDVVPNATFWGIEQNGSQSVAANSLTLNGSRNGVSFVVKNGSSTYSYINATQTRVYNGYTMTITAPTDAKIIGITFTSSGNWNCTPTVNNGKMSDSKTWAGNNNSVTFSFSGTCQIDNIRIIATGITIVPAVFTSISVKTKPTTSYTVGDTFDPAGLVITKHFDDSSTDDVAYAGHESEFSFNPSLTTELATTDKKVTITYSGKSVDLPITVNEAGGSALTYSFTIQTSDFNTSSYDANNKSHDFTAICTTDKNKTMNVSCTSYQVMQQSSVMQWQKSKGLIYNTTDLGTINSVTVNSSAGTFTTYYGTSQKPNSGTDVGNGYFSVKVGSATGKTSSIVVTFTK